MVNRPGKREIIWQPVEPAPLCFKSIERKNALHPTHPPPGSCPVVFRGDFSLLNASWMKPWSWVEKRLSVKFCQKFQGNSLHAEFLKTYADNYKAQSTGLLFFFFFPNSRKSLSQIWPLPPREGEPHRLGKEGCAASKRIVPHLGTRFYPPPGDVLSHLQFLTHLNTQSPGEPWDEDLLLSHFIYFFYFCFFFILSFCTF